MKNQWTPLSIPGPELEINQEGLIRQKEMRIRGTWHYDVLKKPSSSRGGYRYINVTHEGNQKNYYVHRLVAETFIPNVQNKPCVNHKDGDKDNNAVSNLEWVTHSENTLHGIKLGLIKPPPPGSASKGSMFTDDERRDILKRINEGDKQVDIARDYGVTRSLISHVKAGRR